MLLPSAPRVSIDINLSSLQEFLDKVVTLVNQKIVYTQKVSEDVSTKISYSDGRGVFEGLALLIHQELGDQVSKSKEFKDTIYAANYGIQCLCDKVKEIDTFKEDILKTRKI